MGEADGGCGTVNLFSFKAFRARPVSRVGGRAVENERSAFALCGAHRTGLFISGDSGWIREQTSIPLVAPPSMAALGDFMHKHLPPRWDSTDAWYFVTVVTHERYPYFESKEACRILMDACHSVWGRHRYRLGALVIMPDHWHALIKPQDKEVIESIVGSIKQRVFHASRRDGGVKKVIRWQKRFMDHRVRNEEDYLQHLEYMRLNPYKHQLVNDEKEPWRWWFVHKDPFA